MEIGRRYANTDPMLCFVRILKYAVLNDSFHGYDSGLHSIANAGFGSTDSLGATTGSLCSLSPLLYFWVPRNSFRVARRIRRPPPLWQSSRGYGAKPRTLFFKLTETLASSMFDSPTNLDLPDGPPTVRELCDSWLGSLGVAREENFVPTVAVKVFAPFSSLILSGKWSCYAWPAPRDLASQRFLKLKLVKDFMGDWRGLQRQFLRGVRRAPPANAAADIEHDDDAMPRSFREHIEDAMQTIRNLVSRIPGATEPERQTWAEELRSLEKFAASFDSENMEVRNKHWVYKLEHIVHALLLGAAVKHQRNLQDIVLSSLRVVLPRAVADKLLQSIIDRLVIDGRGRFLKSRVYIDVCSDENWSTRSRRPPPWRQLRSVAARISVVVKQRPVTSVDRCLPVSTSTCACDFSMRQHLSIGVFRPDQRCIGTD